MLDVVNSSAVASPLIRQKTRMMINDDDAPACLVTGMIKAFDIVLTLAQDEEIPAPSCGDYANYPAFFAPPHAAARSKADRSRSKPSNDNRLV
jgi:3-hydroxyisobutyrate dehydrogenase-like beta-hydroxyacid dehydrogenase